jgi:hypothetical protein
MTTFSFDEPPSSPPVCLLVPGGRPGWLVWFSHLLSHHLNLAFS